VSVTVNDAGKSVVERLYLDVLRWEVLKVDVSDCTTWDAVAQKVGRGMSRMLEQSNVCHAVRLVLEGSTPLHGLLFGNGAALRAQVIAQAASIDSEKLWVEKVTVATSAPGQLQVAPESREALSELQVILSEAKADPDFLAQLQEELAPFLNKLSDDVKYDVPLLSLAREQRFDDLVSEVAPGLLARLSAKVS
jgi:hypothetical protein